MAHDFNTSMRRACFHGDRTLVSVGLSPEDVVFSSKSSTTCHIAFFAANANSSNTDFAKSKRLTSGFPLLSMPSPVGQQARAHNIGDGSIKVWNLLSSMVVEERRFADELNKKRLAAHLASALAVSVHPMAFSENPLMRILQRKIPDVVSSSLNEMEPLSPQRRFIGNQQMNQIYSLTTFTESDVRKLVAVFALEEINGVLPESGFWSILAVAHSKQLLKVQTVVESISAVEVEPDDGKAPTVLLRRVQLIPIPRILIPAVAQEPMPDTILEDEYPLYLNEDTLFAKRLFSYFDVEASGNLTFQQFIRAIAIFCGSATYATLAELAFEIFDLRNDFIVSKDEMLVCATAIHLSGEVIRRNQAISAAAVAAASAAAASVLAAASEIGLEPLVVVVPEIIVELASANKDTAALHVVAEAVLAVKPSPLDSRVPMHTPQHSPILKPLIRFAPVSDLVLPGASTTSSINPIAVAGEDVALLGVAAVDMDWPSAAVILVPDVTETPLAMLIPTRSTLTMDAATADADLKERDARVLLELKESYTVSLKVDVYTRAMASVQDRDLDLEDFTALTVKHPRILSLFRISSLDELCVKRLAIEQMTIAQFNAT